ncbi:MAG: hypothetical protein VR64_13995 [Desulfatitalea sp. BRH_c12]|nr:MAG: hypothetical protein VR64_13995 [Desulfatitalea sp. BRH_c12]
MQIQTTGHIANGLYVTGSAGVPVYLLDGPSPVLFDAGMTVLAQCYVNDIRAVLGTRSPAYLFLTHAHFDHVGAAGFFKNVWPDMQVVASAPGRDILSRPGAIALIRTLNAESVQMAKDEGLTPLNDAPFESVAIDDVADQGSCFELGAGTVIQALHCPGHTRDFMCYWIASKKILIASEAVGCDDGTGYIQPEFLVDYDCYMANLTQLARLDADILCPGHKMVVTGDDARDHMRRSADYAHRFLAMVETFLTEADGDIDAATAKVKASEWDPRPWPKQPEHAYLLNTRQRVLKTWNRMQFLQENAPGRTRAM